LSEDEKHEPFKVEILEKLATLIAASFAFVAAFAWNESFKRLIEYMFGEETEIIVYFIYSIIITFVAVMIMIMVVRATEKAKARLEK
jgi:hypothetical protein